MLADYKADGTDCENARGTFNSEWNQIVFGRGDPKKLLAAYDIYSLRIRATCTAGGSISQVDHSRVARDSEA